MIFGLMRCSVDEPIRAHEECAEDDYIIIAMSHFRLNRKINFIPPGQYPVHWIQFTSKVMLPTLIPDQHLQGISDELKLGLF